MALPSCSGHRGLGLEPSSSDSMNPIAACCWFCYPSFSAKLSSWSSSSPSVLAVSETGVPVPALKEDLMYVSGGLSLVG